MLIHATTAGDCTNGEHIDCSPKVEAFLADAPKSKEQITTLILNMLIDDLLPVNTVTHSGLKNLIKYLAPNYTMPCSASITTRLEAKHNELTQRAISLLPSPSILEVCLTTDMWTSITMEGFIGLTYHYISEKKGKNISRVS